MHCCIKVLKDKNLREHDCTTFVINETNCGLPFGYASGARGYWKVEPTKDPVLKDFYVNHKDEYRDTASELIRFGRNFTVHADETFDGFREELLYLLDEEYSVINLLSLICSGFSRSMINLPNAGLLFSTGLDSIARTCRRLKSEFVRLLSRKRRRSHGLVAVRRCDQRRLRF